MPSRNSFTREKKTFGGKVKSAFKKAAVGTLAAGALAGGGYNQWGTVHTKIVKATITQIDTNPCDSDSYNGDYTDCVDGYKYEITVDGKSYHDDNAWWHGKFSSNSIADKNYNAFSDGSGDPYTGNFEIKYYGLNIPLLSSPNILSMKHLTNAQLKQIKANQAAAAAKAKKHHGGTTTTTTSNGNGNGNGSSGLSGSMTSYDITVSGYKINVTVPVEAQGKVTINTVVPTPKPAAAPKP